MSEFLTAVYVVLLAGWILGVGAYFLWIGLTGLRRRRALLFPGRRLVWILAPGLILSQVISGISNLASSSPSLSRNYFPFISAAFWIFWAVTMWFQFNGYMIMAVRGDSLREALHEALQRLNLPYQESLTQIHLDSLDADLQVTIGSRSGNSQIRVKQAAKREAILSTIIPALRQQLDTQAIVWMPRPLYLYVALGLLVVVGGPLVMLFFAFETHIL